MNRTTGIVLILFAAIAGIVGVVSVQSAKTACQVEFNESGGLEIRNCTFVANPENGRTKLPL
jgi:hypothetical protein